MSQSDYIQNKKQTRILEKPKDLDSILSSHIYTHLKGYNITMNNSNTLITPNQLKLSSKQNVFGMPITPVTCTDYPFCTNTNERSNRILNIKSNNYVGNEIYPGQTNGFNEYFTFQKYNNAMCLSKDFYDCDEFLYKRRYTTNKGT